MRISGGCCWPRRRPQSGLAAQSFDNGSGGAQAALSQEVAIVLLDVDMPGMDGYAVCRRLRAEPRFATVPIVMVTGHEDSGAISRAFEAGATDFISKPVNWALLPRRLAYILRNAAAAERIERLAYFDTLTGLPNRQRCIETAERLFADAARRSSGRASSTWISTASSASTTPSVIRSAMPCSRTSRASSTRVLAPFQAAHDSVSVARFGGDEFVVLVGDARGATRSHSKSPARAPRC